ncbi:MAG: hypothetical protein EOP24_13400 [Hyphomicrobiales bacterium]|jgi:hypothetical protein|nr:MAG: hypothetical protein EOP24_13400 [Hyphomicrobiales bacterium]
MRRLLTVLAVVSVTSPALAQAGAQDYDSFVPTTELVTATEAPPDTALVRRLFTLAFTEPCNAAIDGGYGGTEPQVFDLTYKGSYDEPDAAERKFRLYQFNCNGGAYNFSSVFYGWDEIDGLQPLSLPSPSIKPTYDEAAGDGDGKLVKLQLTGMTASFLVTNAEVDAKSGTIAATAYWRGIGDASSTGVWSLADGEYRLVSYDVDASYDGEVNPIRVFDRSAPEDISLPN